MTTRPLKNLADRTEGESLPGIATRLAPKGRGELCGDLDRQRALVDAADYRILELLGARMELVREIGALKATAQARTFQPSRWAEILESRCAAGERAGLARDFVRRLFETIHDEAIRQQAHVQTRQGLPGDPRGH